MNFKKPSLFILKKTIEHLELTVFSVVVALLFAVLIRFLLFKLKKKYVNEFVICLILVIRTIPALALMGLIVALLMLIQNIIKTPITGIFPGVFVLVFYAFMPILNSTLSGVGKILPKHIAIAKNLKITKRQVFWVKIQLILPQLLKGVRSAIVLTVSMATLVSLLGSGGLGDLIIEGLKSSRFDLILAGSLPAAFLGISFYFLMSFIIKKVTSTR